MGREGGQDDFRKQILRPSFVQVIENNIEDSVNSIVCTDYMQFKRQDRIAAERNPGMKSTPHSHYNQMVVLIHP